MKKELDKLKDTYYPYWKEMKDEILARDPYPSPEFVSELQSILNRAYMNAMEVGFNEGWKFSLDQLMHLIERSSFDVGVKEVLRQMVEIQKAKVDESE